LAPLRTPFSLFSRTPTESCPIRWPIAGYLLNLSFLRRLALLRPGAIAPPSGELLARSESIDDLKFSDDHPDFPFAKKTLFFPSLLDSPKSSRDPR